MQLFPSQPPREPRCQAYLPAPCPFHHPDSGIFQDPEEKAEAGWVGSGLRGGEQMIQEWSLTI